MRTFVLTAAAASLALSAPLQAQDKAAPSAEAVKEVVPQVRTRDLVGTFGGQRIAYRATIADTVIRSVEDKPEAVIVTTS